MEISAKTVYLCAKMKHHVGWDLNFDGPELPWPMQIEPFAAGLIPNLKKWDYKSVSSPFWRLYFNNRRGKFIVCRKKIYSITADKFLLIPEGVTFDCCGTGIPDHLYVHFRLPFIYCNKLSYPVEIKRNPLLKALAVAVISSLSQVEISRHITTLFLKACLFEVPLIPESKIFFPYHAKIRDCERCGAIPLNNKHLASKLGLSPRSLQRIMKRDLGISPHAYLQGLRIRRAKYLLLNGEQGIDQIASECGYSDRFHFSKVFKQQTGLSPAFYRRKQLAARGITENPD